MNWVNCEVSYLIDYTQGKLKSCVGCLHHIILKISYWGWKRL